MSAESEHVHHCLICQNAELAPSYYDWRCTNCGQNYEYDEAERICLTPR